MGGRSGARLGQGGGGCDGSNTASLLTTRSRDKGEKGGKAGGGERVQASSWCAWHAAAANGG
ncbi:hypothetical protein E2562_015564 [Oryza meyeriana var. granulata]|uniref:Uncharacterized protein n=1 Tax=Oryza meyeriana var. granulata TaxID=110450 RepID=A0A6G1CGC5_9ORYZ|nr:hypothetical protein E2562_015564 [Oryza meyeriana var. granulata]